MNRIDLIIDALELFHDTPMVENERSVLLKALAAARELKALKPVAWLTVEGHETTSAKVVISISMQKQINGIPLYALEVTK
jgi:hypothetical protein